MLRYLLFGLLFGFALSRSGATDYDAIAGMFLLQDLRLMGVIGVAILLAAPAFAWLRRRRIAGPIDCAISLKPKPRKAGNIVGGLLFGAGWALTGTCPGTGLAQLGEGKLVAGFTIAGMLVGTLLYRRYGAAVESWLARRPPPRWRAASAAALEHSS